jgi:hypothetical protein
MAKERKGIPPPINLTPPKQPTVGEKYPLPFMLAEHPRMLLNFLALHSNIPEAYRNMISSWLHEYNHALMDYIGQHYGQAALQEANLIAIAMGEGFLESIAEDRENADKEMFSNLDREIFGDGSS